jgi:long-chain acyl-CoA synthetase
VRRKAAWVTTVLLDLKEQTLPATTDAQTIAALIPRAVASYADNIAVRSKREGAWEDVTYAELGEIVDELALGLIDLGIDAGERLSILSNTRAEWSYADMAATSAGVVVVPIYQTNSAGECHWVLSDSEVCAVVCENAEQLIKIAAVRDRLPHLRTVIVMDMPTGADGAVAAELDAISLDEVRRRGRDKDAAELERRRAAVTLQDTFTIIYTSGTTGPPKGCVLSHGNYSAMLNSVREGRLLDADNADVVYLYLPLAHVFALLIQLSVFDLGVTLAYWSGDTTKIVAELNEVHPTYLPSVPRLFEKIFTLVSANTDPGTLADATRVGLQVRELQMAGKEIPEELQAPFAAAEEKLFGNVRAVFGGRLREALTGAAPIGKEILEFFFAAGVPVMEGYGMTETATGATFSTPGNHRFGSIGKPLPGVEVSIADDGELLVRGANVFQGYYRHGDLSFGDVVDGWLHTGDLGRIDEDGYVYIVGRKKDIIITAGGKNITPANIENDMKRNRYISQAVLYGDRRPYVVMLVTLDAEEILPWAASEGLAQDIPTLASEPRVRELVQAHLDAVNQNYAPVEQVKRFAILDHDLSQETGELTPTLKVKRNVVAEKYAELLDSIYAG